VAQPPRKKLARTPMRRPVQFCNRKENDNNDDDNDDDDVAITV